MSLMVRNQEILLWTRNINYSSLFKKLFGNVNCSLVCRALCMLWRSFLGSKRWCMKINVKVSVLHPVKAYGEVDLQLNQILISVISGSEWSASRIGWIVHSPPRRKTPWFWLKKVLDGAQGQCWRFEEEQITCICGSPSGLVEALCRLGCLVLSCGRFLPRWILSLILRRSRTGTVWFYISTSNKRAARPKLYTKSLIRDLKLMYSRITLVRISINL